MKTSSLDITVVATCQSQWSHVQKAHSTSQRFDETFEWYCTLLHELLHVHW